MSGMDSARLPRSSRGRARRARLGLLFRRGPWENAATVLIVCGVVMLMQPFSAWLYGWSFGVVLAGTFGFVVVSHFPD